MSVRRQISILRPQRGLPLRLLHEYEPGPLVCECQPSRPRRIDGIWFALDLYECRTCGRKVTES